MKEILVVGMGGFLGASLRYAIGTWVTRFNETGFPFNTFFINIVGCFLIGIFFENFDCRTQADNSTSNN